MRAILSVIEEEPIWADYNKDHVDTQDIQARWNSTETGGGTLLGPLTFAGNPNLVKTPFLDLLKT